MNTFLKLTAAAAALAGLTACDALGLGGEKSGGGNAAAPAAQANASADTNSAGGKDPAAAGGNVSTAAAFNGEVTRQFLVGRWTDNNDCSSTIQFNADGRFVAPTGEGYWVLDGDRITFQGSSSVSARVQAPDANTIMLIHDDGTVGRSTRCTS
jgi:membrane protein involved in colicin uptake